MALSKELLEKKSITLYKAFSLSEGERMVINVSGETFDTTINAAVSRYLKTIGDERGIEEVQNMLGKTFQIFKTSFYRDVYTNPNYVDLFNMDGKGVVVRLRGLRYPSKIQYVSLMELMVEPEPVKNATEDSENNGKEEVKILRIVTHRLAD